MTVEDDTRRAQLEAEARRLGLTPSTLQMSRAVGTDLLNDIRRDNRRSVHQQGTSILPAPPAPAKPSAGHNGWVEAAPLRNGYNPLIERQLDAADARDRAERERRFGKSGGR